MKIFTRFLLLLALASLAGGPAWAAPIAITVGDNYYEYGGVKNGEVSINVGDVVTWSYPVGTSSHPTMSDSPTPAWPIFQMNASSRTSPAPGVAFNTPGVYPYHCTVHGAFVNGVVIGMGGNIKVNPATVTATEDARLTALALNLYPNPSRGYVTVQLRQKLGPSYQLRINNIIGQEIRSVALRPDLSAAGLPLDLSSLPSGLYFYSLLVDGKVASTKRLVLQN